MPPEDPQAVSGDADLYRLLLGDTRLSPPPGSANPAPPLTEQQRDLKKLLQPWTQPKQDTSLPPTLLPLVAGSGTLGYEDLEKLRKAAAAADDLAEGLRRDLGRAGKPTDAAAVGLKAASFASGAALEALLTSWEKGAKGFADRVESVSPRLRKTAAAYRGTESHIRDELSRIWFGG
ncbi:hypothetical protein ABGB12_01345 [Actinocorallia sp. B10E7]|uniref:hypothetical protein n=1 Tax=Actinocorallia sp. B10E7 TaxID=3153558 RepID=UPI00325E0B99